MDVMSIAMAVLTAVVTGAVSFQIKSARDVRRNQAGLILKVDNLRFDCDRNETDLKGVKKAQAESMVRQKYAVEDIDALDKLTRKHECQLGILNDRHPQPVHIAGVAADAKVVSTGKSSERVHQGA